MVDAVSDLLEIYMYDGLPVWKNTRSVVKYPYAYVQHNQRKCREAIEDIWCRGI